MEQRNRDQRTFWNDAPGRKWVDRQVDLDHLHASVLDLVVARAALQPGERVLDIGCGAGASCLALAREVGPEGRVIGLDISEPLLALARERAAGTPNVELQLGDAQTDAPGRDFDVVTSRFGVMFFDDPVAAFANIATLMRPGGRMIFAAWARQEDNPWFRLPLEAAVERLGPAPAAGDPDGPGPMAFRDIDRVTGLLRQAGLADVGGERVALELVHPGGSDVVHRLALEIGTASRHVRDMNGDEADVQAIREALKERLAVFDRDGAFRIPAAINLFTARRPGAG